MRSMTFEKQLKRVFYNKDFSLLPHLKSHSLVFYYLLNDLIVCTWIYAGEMAAIVDWRWIYYCILAWLFLHIFKMISYLSFNMQQTFFLTKKYSWHTQKKIVWVLLEKWRIRSSELFFIISIQWKLNFLWQISDLDFCNLRTFIKHTGSSVNIFFSISPIKTFNF